MRRHLLSIPFLIGLSALVTSGVIAFACSSGADARHAKSARKVAQRSGGIIADHRAVSEFDKIPPEVIKRAKEQFAIFYGRTSHGSQIEVGLDLVAAEKGSPYKVSTAFLKTKYGDLGEGWAMRWAKITEEALRIASFNVVMWSWCGGASKSTAEEIQLYLDAMDRLEKKHPGVLFIYMTGRTDKWRLEVTRANNKLIRDYAKKNGKVLYDFEAIESWDLEGNFHEDANDDCAWCATWCESHECPSCGECPHSHCLNCFNKGKAFWWMMARLTGWPDQPAPADE